MSWRNLNFANSNFITYHVSIVLAILYQLKHGLEIFSEPRIAHINVSVSVKDSHINPKIHLQGKAPKHLFTTSFKPLPKNAAVHAQKDLAPMIP